MSGQFLILLGSCAVGSAIGGIPSMVVFFRIRRQLVDLVDQQRAERVLPRAGAGAGAMAAHRLRQEAGQGGSDWSAT